MLFLPSVVGAMSSSGPTGLLPLFLNELPWTKIRLGQRLVFGSGVARLRARASL
jgi:hypothetical protein